MLQQGLKELRHRERQDELTISKQQREIAALHLSLQGMRQQLKVRSQHLSPSAALQVSLPMAFASFACPDQPSSLPVS